MNDFLRQKHRAEGIPSFLVERVSGFRESAEYQALRPYELEIPGVVCGAFAGFLSRIHQEEGSGARAKITPIAESAHQALEDMASVAEVVVYLTDEVFENLDLTPKAECEFKQHLGPNARVLYDQWRRQSN